MNSRIENGSLLKVGEVAEILQLSARQILNLCKSTAHTPLPHLKINNRSLRFRRADLEVTFPLKTAHR
jgi:helix-turn-helix protein